MFERIRVNGKSVSYLMNPGEVSRKLLEVVLQIGRRELGLPLDVFEDNRRRGEELAPSIQVIRSGRGQAGSLQNLKQPELGGEIRVPMEIGLAIPAHHDSLHSAIKLLDFERCNMGRDPSGQRPGANQPTLRPDLLHKSNESWIE